MRIWKIRRCLILSFLLIYSLSNFNMISSVFAAGNKSDGQSKSNVTATTKNEKYGNWKFTVTTTTDNSVSPSKVTKAAKITQYSGTSDTTVVVPGILDGAVVNEIGSQAFARHSEILALYVPDGITKIDSWAFYDCNSVAVISIANANVALSTDAFESNPNVVVYLNSKYNIENTNKLANALGSENKISKTDYTETTVDIEDLNNNDSYVVVYLNSKYNIENTNKLANALGSENKISKTDYTETTVDIEDLNNNDSYTAADKTLCANYGTYLNVKTYPISKTNISVTPRGTGCKINSNTFNSKTNTYIYTISGTLTGIVDYSLAVTIADSLKGKVKAGELNKTFRALTQSEADKLNKKIASDSSYGAIKGRFNFEKGYYINGNRVNLDPNVMAYDVKTGTIICKYVNGTATYGKLVDANNYDNLSYKYIAYKDTDNDGDVDVIYYSPFDLNVDEDNASILDDDKYLNGLSARKEMDPTYYSFANSVITADGKNLEYDNPLKIKSADTSFVYTDKNGQNQIYKGDRILEGANQERSILWATNYGTIKAKKINAKSTSTGNWAKMSYETGLTNYNTEVVMQWGMNALLYATQGGTVILGEKGNNTYHSTLLSTGDGANGVIAACGGKNVGSSTAKSSTSKVYVYNTKFNLEGWNNHVADCVYGGYAHLENVTASTGKKGSYSVGQASSLANDFGNGVVEVNNYTAKVYGNRSAGAYVIGSGVISADKSSLTSYADAGAVIASGGTYHITDSQIKGVMGIKNRGGGTGTSDISNSTITAFRNYNDYITGNKAKSAIEAWKNASGSYVLMQYMMSDPTMTMGKLCKNYNIAGTAKKTLLNKLSNIANKRYTDSTPLRNSVLDNTYYNYSAGSYTGSTDFYYVPYLTVGSSFGGNINSALDFEASNTTLNLTNNKYINKNKNDYNYLIASEAGSSPTVNFVDSNGTINGIIWNEGNVSRAVEGIAGNRKSSLKVSFKNSNFKGNFADGSLGLWDGSAKYTNNAGITTKLNGNYYGAAANWGITASFDKNSKWKVTNNSYVGELTIADLNNISADKPVTVYYNTIGSGSDKKLTNGVVYNKVTFIHKVD